MEFSDREIAESDKESNNIAFFCVWVMGKKGLFTLVSVALLWSPFHKKSVQSRMLFKGKKETIWFINFFPLTGQTNCKNIKTWKTTTTFYEKNKKLSCPPSMASIMCQTDLHAKEGTIYFSYCTFVFYLIFRLRTRKEVKKECTERIRMSTVKDKGEGCVRYRQEKRTTTTNSNKIIKTNKNNSEGKIHYNYKEHNGK